ncbi:probable flavin-containing monooxygenase 1 [Mercurialis annua]|uniref:probable flavin-containing monooxygenase 1 n=1 Tax=Mercurialis annua TaxID=3986 RepID=UPI00215E6242|nr:probable flavin-containing monooxygenase 1 [Mercurialis annua]
MARQNNLIVSKIGIIGAGVSGLAMLKQLAHHNPLVFEASDSVGGVWKTCSYNSTKLQSSRTDYEFTDFLWPNRDDPNFPSYLEILDYLRSYAECFDLMKYIRFNSKVVELRFVGDRKAADCSGHYGSLLPGQHVWEVAVQTNQTDTIQWYAFEFLVVCTGKYGDIPKIPKFPKNGGPEIFKGQVLHSLDYCKLDKEAASHLLKGKKVAVVGFKKSAIDLALECAQANQGADGQQCTMVVRTLHWTVPHYWIWGLPFFLFFSTRSSQFIHEKPNQTLLNSLFCLLFSPIRHVVSKFIESYLLYKLPLHKYGLKPDHPFIEDYASCQMAIMPENFFSEADKGNILFKRTSNWCFTQDGLQFEDNTKLQADVVIFATGYNAKKKLQNIIPEPFFSLLEYPYGVMPLYRGTIHPLIPNMAFAGFIESVSNLHTAELRSIWLARLIDNKFKLPTAEKMLKQVSKEIEVMKRTTRFYKKKHCISTFSIDHSDEICDEMGWSSWRKKNLLAEAFSPYGSQDYEQEE